MKWILLILFILNSRAHADDLRALLEAHSTAELESRMHQSSELAATREQCASELRTHLIPRACFKVLALTHQPVTSRLTRVCIENAKSSRSRLDLGGVMDRIPDTCRQSAAERLEDLQYIDESKCPETSVMRPDVGTVRESDLSD